jgi:hypothetical protein
MALNQAQGTPALMLATKLVMPGRIVTRCGAVAHFGQCSRCEQLKLPHAVIIPQPTAICRPES